MQLTSIQHPFAQASTLLTTAVKSLEFPPNAKIDVKVAMGTSLKAATQAVELLTPLATDGDMFVSRNAAAAVETAKAGVSALTTAIATIDAGATAPQIPVATFIEIAKNSFTQAESALWWE